MSGSHDASAHAAMRALMMPATLPDPEQPGQEIEFNQTDRNVYAYLVYRAGGGRLCWKTVGEIMADLGIGTRQTVCNATARLRRAGLIEVKHRRRDSNHYHILDPGRRLYPSSGGNGATEWQQPPLQDVKETVLLEPQGVKETALLDDHLDVKETALLEPQGVKETALLGVLDVKETVHQSLNPVSKITQEKEPTHRAGAATAAAEAAEVSVCVGNFDFEMFWSCYPKKVKRGRARAAWDIAITKAPASTIVAAVQQFVWPQETRWIPDPHNWLAAEQWWDEVSSYDDDILRAAGLDPRDYRGGPTIDGDAVRSPVGVLQ